MHSIGASGNGDIGARVDEKASSQFVVPSSRLILANRADRRSSKQFERPRRKIFFTQLDVLHPAACSLGDALQEQTVATVFVTRKLGAVSDVVEKQIQSPVVRRP